jgi:hypothetical protein
MSALFTGAAQSVTNPVVRFTALRQQHPEWDESQVRSPPGRCSGSFHIRPLGGLLQTDHHRIGTDKWLDTS